MIFYRNLREITIRLTNVIPERIIFVSRGITVYCLNCGLDDPGFEPQQGLKICLLQNTQTVFRPTHKLVFNGYRGFFIPGVRRPAREFHHSPSSFIKVKSKWIYTSTPPDAFVAYSGTALHFFKRETSWPIRELCCNQL